MIRLSTISTLFSLHDALPIYQVQVEPAAHDDGRQVGHVPTPHLTHRGRDVCGRWPYRLGCLGAAAPGVLPVDRKSTRLNSSHVAISYAVFCLKKKNTQNI